MGFKIFLVLSIFNLPQFSTFPPLTEESRRTQFQSSREQRVQVSWFQLQIQIRIVDRFPACSVLRVFLLSIQYKNKFLARSVLLGFILYTEDRFLVYTVLLKFILYRGQVSSLLRPTGVYPIYNRFLVYSVIYWSSSYIQRIGLQFTPS